jgi:signal peptidase I
MIILSRMIDNFFKVTPTGETLNGLLKKKKEIEKYASTFGLFIFEEESIKMNSHIRKAQLNKHNTEIFSIIGNSMLPTLPPSTSVMVDKDVSFEEIKEGDIIVYKSNYNSHSSKLTPYVIHRVYSKRGDKIICKGDNNSVIDKECITSSNLVGKAITINQSLVND